MYYNSSYGQANQPDPYGQFTQHAGQQGSPYGQYGATPGKMGKEGAMYIGAGGKMQPRKRLNLVAIILSLFVPWLTFCLIFAMLTFDMHYRKAASCKTISAIVGVVYGVLCLSAILSLVRRWTSEEAAARETPSWLLFLSVTALVGLVIAVALGDRNYWINMQPYYDVTALNSYQGVDPATMLGKEIMDAGRVKFVSGVHVDVARSMSFKNQDTYCVAPIAGGSVQGNPPLSNYDFWAVGKNCCSGAPGDFACGDVNNSHARGGVRVVRDEDRAFYRLAVQQAQSVHTIKSLHPLFFHWVEDPIAQVKGYKREGYKWYLAGMFWFFLFQFVLVCIAVCAFATRDWTNCCPTV